MACNQIIWLLLCSPLLCSSSWFAFVNYHLKNRKKSKQVMNVSMLGWIMITHNVNTRVLLWASSLFHIILKLRAAQLLWTTWLLIFRVLSLLIRVIFKKISGQWTTFLTFMSFLVPGVTHGSRDPTALEVLPWWCFRGSISVVILEISTSVIAGFAVVSRQMLHHVQC